MRTALLATLVSLTLSGCLYVNVTQPLDTDMYETRMGNKTGESSSYILFWAFAWGDAGTHAAAKNGEITTIYNADTKLKSYALGIYTKRTTVVYGD